MLSCVERVRCSVVINTVELLRAPEIIRLTTVECSDGCLWQEGCSTERNLRNFVLILSMRKRQIQTESLAQTALVTK